MWGPVRASDIGATRADSYVGNGGYVVRFGSVNSYILPSVESRITPEALRSLTCRSNSTFSLDPGLEAVFERCAPSFFRGGWISQATEG